MGLVTRETPRLLLRPPIEADLDAYVEIHSDPEVRRHLTIVGGRGGHAAAWRTLALVIGHWHMRGYGQWTVIEKATSRIVGRAGLWNPEGWPGLEVGWVIGRQYWGQGFATEAALAAVEFAFSATDAAQLISMIQPDNHRSIRVAEKIGFTGDGTVMLEGAEMLLYTRRRPPASR
jgi:RimJ/RimL family protein N-acetyltransferase